MNTLLRAPVLLAVIAALTMGATCNTSLLQKGITTGVSLTLPDANAGIDVLQRSAPLLPPGDPWLDCYKTIAGTLQAVQEGPGAAEPVNRILTEAARLHVLDVLMSNLTSRGGGQPSCSDIIVQIELRAAAGATPGGALLPLR